MMIKHQGEVVAVEFTPKYRPGSSTIQRTVSLMDDAKNKKDAVLKDHPEVSFGGRTSLVMIQAGKMPVLTTPKAVILLQDEQKGAVKVGIATSKWAMSPVKSNPSEAVAAAIVDAGKDQKEEMMTTLGKIIPETTQLELANMMSTRGKKAAIDITMAKMASGTEPLRSIPSPVAKMLTDTTGERPVTREKIAYQALGIKPPRAKQIDSRFKSSLRKQITEILGVAGTVTSKTGRAQSLGQLPFIDNHIFITPQHINDFRQMLAMYHLIRERNAPFMELLVPGFSKDIKELIPLDKMIDYLMPSPDHMFRGERVMFFTVQPDIAQADPPGWKAIKDGFKQHMLGLELIAPPALVGQQNARAASSFLRSFNSDSKKMFESVRIATSILVDSPLTLRFDEELGILPPPQIAQVPQSSLPGNVKAKVTPLESDYSVTGAFFERDRKGHKVALSRFTFPYLGYKTQKGKVTAGPFKDKIVQMGVTTGAKLLKPGKTPQPRIKGPKGPTTGGSTPAKQGPQAGAIGLIPLHNQGFTLPPIGWNRGWMIPVMQVMDEYWYMLGSSDSVKLEVHDLLYLIGNQAMESMGYEISAQEYLIILLLLGVFDSTGKSRETQAVELTLKQLEADDSAISKHIKALEKLKGKAVKVEEVTEFAKLTAEEEAAIAKATDKEATEIVSDTDTRIDEFIEKKIAAKTVTEADIDAVILGAPKARRRGVKRPPSILPFIKSGTQGSVGTKYWDKAAIKSLSKATRDMVDSRVKKKMADAVAYVTDIERVLEDSLNDMKAQKVFLKDIEALGDDTKAKLLGKAALEVQVFRKKYAEQRVQYQALKKSGSESIDKFTKQIEKDAQRIVDQTTALASKKGVPAIIQPLLEVLIEGMTAYSSMGVNVDELRSKLEKLLKSAETTVEKAEIVTTKPASEIQGFDELKAIQEEASTRSASLTFSALADWIKANTSSTKVERELKAIRPIIKGIESDTYEEAAVKNAFVMGLGAIMDPNKRDQFFTAQKGTIKATGIAAVLNAVKNLPKAAVKKDVTGEAPLVSKTSGKPADGSDGKTFIVESLTPEQVQEQKEKLDLERLAKKEEELGTGTMDTMRGTEKPAAPKVKRTPTGWSQKFYDELMAMTLKEKEAALGFELDGATIMPPAEVMDRFSGNFVGKGPEIGEIIPPPTSGPNNMAPYISIRLNRDPSEPTEIVHIQKETTNLFVNGEQPPVVALTTKRRAKRSERMYKGWTIRKFKDGYRVIHQPKGQPGSFGAKEFKLLKQAKEYIDAMTDKRRSPVLDGHTCVYMVGKSACGGLLYTMKANPPMHQCRTCGAKYRLEGA